MEVTAARKTTQILKSVEYIVAIELLCAVQAVEFHGSEKLGKGTKMAYSTVRKAVPRLSEDRVLSEDREKILTIKNYANTRFVNIVLEKRVYMRVEQIAEELGSKPNIIINNMLLLTIKKLESITNTT